MRRVIARVLQGIASSTSGRAAGRVALRSTDHSTRSDTAVYRENTHGATGIGPISPFSAGPKTCRAGKSRTDTQGSDGNHSRAGSSPFARALTTQRTMPECRLFDADYSKLSQGRLRRTGQCPDVHPTTLSWPPSSAKAPAPHDVMPTALGAYCSDNVLTATAPHDAMPTALDTSALPRNQRGTQCKARASEHPVSQHIRAPYFSSAMIVPSSVTPSRLARLCRLPPLEARTIAPSRVLWPPERFEILDLKSERSHSFSAALGYQLKFLVPASAFAILARLLERRR